MRKKCLVLSIDYDDCLVRKGTNQENAERYDQIDFNDVVNNHNPPREKTKWKDYLLNHNPQLFAYIEQIAPEYDEIIICCGSNRQNPYIDTTNSCRDDVYSGSCYQGLELFAEEVRIRTKKPVILNRTLIADYFRDKTPGTTFDQTLEWLKGGEVQPDLFTELPNDRSKVSLHYFFMHMLAQERKEQDLDYLAIDDGYQEALHPVNPAIIDGLSDAYSKNPTLIPPNVQFLTVPYKEGELKQDKIKRIKGEALQPNENFAQNMHSMMICSMDAENHQARTRMLNDLKSCNCWDVLAKNKNKNLFLERVAINAPITHHARATNTPVNRFYYLTGFASLASGAVATLATIKAASPVLLLLSLNPPLALLITMAVLTTICCLALLATTVYLYRQAGKPSAPIQSETSSTLLPEQRILAPA